MEKNLNHFVALLDELIGFCNSDEPLHRTITSISVLGEKIGEQQKSIWGDTAAGVLQILSVDIEDFDASPIWFDIGGYPYEMESTATVFRTAAERHSVYGVDDRTRWNRGAGLLKECAERWKSYATSKFVFRTYAASAMRYSSGLSNL